MRFVTVYKAPERNTPPSQEEMDRMGEFIQLTVKAGVLVTTGGCLPSARGARVRRSNGKMIVTDGPFTETKELIAGFAIIDVASKAEAIEWTKRFLEVAGDGETELREMHGGPDPA